MYYLIRYEGKDYANDTLCIAAIAGGERTFLKLVTDSKIKTKKILDHTVYEMSDLDLKRCTLLHPIRQDFDAEYKRFNVLPARSVGKSDAYPDATILRIPEDLITTLHTYRHVKFFKVRDYKDGRKYRMLTRMAKMQICGCLYVALNAVDTRVASPIIATVATAA